jgi:hypothetical protein
MDPIKDFPARIGNVYNYNYSRYGTITSLTVTWRRYTPMANSKKGRFGLRKRSFKVCSFTTQIN